MIAVAKDDRAEVLEDTLIYNFGIHKTLDRENTDKTIATTRAAERHDAEYYRV